MVWDFQDHEPMDPGVLSLTSTFCHLWNASSRVCQGGFNFENFLLYADTTTSQEASTRMRYLYTQLVI